MASEDLVAKEEILEAKRDLIINILCNDHISDNGNKQDIIDIAEFIMRQYYVDSLNQFEYTEMKDCIVKQMTKLLKLEPNSSLDTIINKIAEKECYKKILLKRVTIKFLKETSPVNSMACFSRTDHDNNMQE
jgi:hypothetical protein